MEKGVIFDLDGVICFTDKYHYLAWKRMADQENIYFDEEINNRLRGVSRMASLEIILERATKTYSEEEKIELATKKNEWYREYLLTMTPSDIDESTKETLKELRRRGYRLSIGSSSKNAKLILEKCEITDLFDAISDGTNISRSKPDPEVFLKAAEFLKLKPEDCYVVEDAFAGIDAAKDGGFKAIGIGEASSYSRTDYPIKEFKDILDVVERGN